MLISGLQKTTLIDFPGKVACTVFLAGCNFRCPWCYSKELVLPSEIAKQPRIQESELLGFLSDRKGILDGVVICGGEPTINKDLPKFIEKIKQLGALRSERYAVKLDTNGSNPDMLEKLICENLADYIAMDIKTSQNSDYERLFYEGIKMDNINKSIEILKSGKVDFEFRTTVVPGVHEKKDFKKIAKWIGGENVKYYLQNFRAEKTINDKFLAVKPYSNSFLEEIKKDIELSFKECKIR